MKILLYLLIVFLNFTCKHENIDMKIVLYKDGTSQVLNLSSKENNQVNKIISDIFLGTTEVLKIYFGEERIQELKNAEEVLEIVYAEPILLPAKGFDSLRVKKILFPLSGELIGNNANPEITIITGEEEYDSTPFRNVHGYELLMQLKSLILSSSKE